MESETRAQPDESKGVGSNPPAGVGAPSQSTPTDPARKSSDDSLIANALEQVDAGTGPKPGNGSQPAFGSGGVGPPLGALAANLPVGGSGPSSDNGSSVGGGAIPADIFPGYTLLKELHRGGQGVVYQAIQKATKRKVAIKVMRDGPFASPKDRIRFEREVEILAQLNHPNIVQVHDSGTVKSAGGTLQFFVMDYISGRTLMKHIAEHRPSNEEILKLFAKVCDAINSAHLKGVIHRDIKPGNVKVDSNGEPHVLDFGLAKASGSDVSGGDSPHVMTVTGEFIGSVAYASPEQAERDPNKIDVRTDVYALGVMLYEALTGGMPYSVLGNTIDVLERIKKSMPQRPSRVRKGINNEVETIVLKCLSKERDRRYQNAGELERDLQRYLAGEAIEAKRDSGWYMLTKTLVRHRAVAIGVTGFIAVLIGGAVVSNYYRELAEGSRARAVESEQAAIQQKNISQQALAQEAERSDQLNEVQSFLAGILGSADPDTLKGKDPSIILEVLYQATLRAKTELTTKPMVQATVMEAIGKAYLAIGVMSHAEQHLQAALEVRQAQGGAPIWIADSLNAIADFHWQNGKPLLAEEYLRKELAIRQNEPVPDLAAVARCFEKLGVSLKMLGRHMDAEKAYLQSLAIRESRFGSESIESAETLSSLGELYRAMGDPDKAVHFLERALRAVEKSAGSNNTMWCICKGNLANALRSRGKPGDVERAVAYAKEALDGFRVLLNPLNPDHWYVGVGLNKYGQALTAAGRLDEAEEALRESLERRLRGNPANEHHIALTKLNLAVVLREKRRHEEAATLFAQAEQTLLRTRGPESSDYKRCLIEAAMNESIRGKN